MENCTVERAHNYIWQTHLRQLNCGMLVFHGENRENHLRSQQYA